MKKEVSYKVINRTKSRKEREFLKKLRAINKEVIESKLLYSKPISLTREQQIKLIELGIYLESNMSYSQSYIYLGYFGSKERKIVGTILNSRLLQQNKILLANGLDIKELDKNKFFADLQVREVLKYILYNVKTYKVEEIEIKHMISESLLEIVGEKLKDVIEVDGYIVNILSIRKAIIRIERILLYDDLLIL